MTGTTVPPPRDPSRRVSGAVRVVSLVGEVDLASAAAVEELVDAAVGATCGPGAVVVLDATAVTFLDCAGLGHLLTAQARLVISGSALVLRSPSPAVTALLELTGAALAIETDPRPETPVPEAPVH